MRFNRYVATGFQVAILAFVFTRCARAGILHFNVTGTYDTPNGVYQLASPIFAVNFDLPSDPGNTLSGFELVEVYTTIDYTNNGISAGPFANTLLVFSSASNGGGILFSFPISALFPYGLGVEFSFGGVPQLYSNTPAAPHFSP